MADNYSQFSATIDNLTDAEISWLAQEIEKEEDCDDGPFCEIGVHSRERKVWLYSESYFEPDRLGDFVQRFLKRFRPNEQWGTTWSATCSKPRLGEFSGAALFVTAEEIKIFTAGDWLEQQQQQPFDLLHVIWNGGKDDETQGLVSLRQRRWLTYIWGTFSGHHSTLPTVGIEDADFKTILKNKQANWDDVVALLTHKNFLLPARAALETGQST